MTISRFFGLNRPSPARGTYTIKAVCKNCGRGEPDGEDMVFDMGVPIKDHACKTCGCLALKPFVATAKRAPAASSPESPSALPVAGIYGDVFKALIQLGYKRQEARDAVLAVMKDSPTEKDVNQVLALAIRKMSTPP